MPTCTKYNLDVEEDYCGDRCALPWMMDPALVERPGYNLNQCDVLDSYHILLC